MNSCKHNVLTLLSNNSKRLKCRHCHLTIKPDELKEGYCPECFEAYGKKRYDFEEIDLETDNITQYRCEECHAIIKC